MPMGGNRRHAKEYFCGVCQVTSTDKSHYAERPSCSSVEAQSGDFKQREYVYILWFVFCLSLSDMLYYEVKAKRYGLVYAQGF